MKLWGCRIQVVVVLLGVLFFLGKMGLESSSIRIATQDEINLQKAIENPDFGFSNRLYDYRIGRFYADVKFDFLEWLLALESNFLVGLIRSLLLALAVGSTGLLVWAWTRDGRTAGLTVIAMAGWFAITVSYQAYLSLPHYWIGWSAIWLMGFFALQADTPLNRVMMVGAFVLALIIHESNAVFLVWPWMVRWARFGSGDLWKVLWKSSAWCTLVLCVYGILALQLRAQVAGEAPYSGGTIALQGKSIVYAWQVFTLSGLPGLESWVSGRTLAGSLWLTPDMWFARLGSTLSFWDLVGASLVGGLFWRWMPEDRVKQSGVNNTRLLAFTVMLLFAAYAPNALLALTPKYQIWAHQRMWPYYFSSMSYLAWIVLGVGWAVAAYRGTRSPLPRRILRGLFTGLAILLVLTAASVTKQSVVILKANPFVHTHSQ